MSKRWLITLWTLLSVLFLVEAFNDLLFTKRHFVLDYVALGAVLILLPIIVIATLKRKS